MAEEYKYEEDIVDQPDVMLTDDALEEKENRKEYEQESEMHSLAASMTEKWEEYKNARTDIEHRWLEDLRSFNSQYDSDVLSKVNSSEGKRSKVYVGLTRTKCIAAYSRIVDLLFQAGDRFWNIEPTPIADLGPQAEQDLAQQAIQEVTQLTGEAPVDSRELIGARMDELAGDFQDEMQARAKQASDDMQALIEDQLVEEDAEIKIKQALMEMVIMGSGCIKSATIKIKKTERFFQDPADGQFTLMYEEEPAPDIEAVSIFDIYPDPYASTMNEADGLFRRHILNRSQFKRLGESDGFDQELIDQCLRMYAEGNHTEASHEKERRDIANVNRLGESNRFEVLEYWGLVSGHDLESYGLEIEDEADQYQANVWVSSGKVLKVQMNPMLTQKIPYQIFPYEKTPHQFWGVGVARMMRDSQATMNAATRMYIDNIAISSAPMIEVNSDLLAAGEDPTDIYPMRVFIREGGDASVPMMRFYQPNNVTQGLGNIIEMFRTFADETTSLPSYTHGEQSRGLNKTATGISMLMGAANVALKSTIKNIDDYLTKPLIESLYYWNMEWSEDDAVKGDSKVVARGSSALIAKEMQSQRLLQFLEITSNPMDAPLIKRKKLLEDVAASMDIDPEQVIVTDEELQQAVRASMQGDPSANPDEGMEAPTGPPSGEIDQMQR